MYRSLLLAHIYVALSMFYMNYNLRCWFIIKIKRFNFLIHYLPVLYLTSPQQKMQFHVDIHANNTINQHIYTLPLDQI